jgi:spore coat polysaccharide biosynthesis predicted glycosyltransferase SpsG
MKFLLVTECSPLIGTGHVMRSITLGTAIRQLGHDVCFYPEWLCQWGQEAVVAQGFQISLEGLEEAAGMSQLTIMDGYNFDLNLMQRVMAKGPLAVVEDFLHRAIRCDVLLDPNIGAEATFFKSDTVEFNHYIGGSRFVTLSASVLNKSPAPPKSKSESLLISFGGSDPGFASENVLPHLIHSPDMFERVALVVGPMFGHDRKLELEAQVANSPIEIIGPLDSLGPLYRQFRWALGAGGTSAYERVFQMIPSLNLVTQSNQERLASKLSELGLALSLDVRSGDYSDTSSALEAIRDSMIEKRLEAFQSEFRDGDGATNIAKELETYLSG